MSQDTYESETTPIYERLKRKMELKYSNNVESAQSYQTKVKYSQKEFESLTEEQKNAIVDFDINENNNTKLAQDEFDKWTSQDNKALVDFNINEEFDAEAKTQIAVSNN